jgi:hypothetical protein
MTTHTFRSGLHDIARATGAALGRLGVALARARGAQGRFDRLRRLQSLSDSDLERRGLRREDLPRHVFSDLFAD